MSELSHSEDKTEYQSIFGRYFMESFGTRLMQLRKNKNLSQEDFAAIMDVSRQSISKWENDSAYPETEKLIFMRNFFGVSLDYLILGNNPEKTIKGEGEPMCGETALLKSVNSFLSNLNDKKKFILGLTIMTLILICVFIFYELGYAVGEALYWLTN